MFDNWEVNEFDIHRFPTFPSFSYDGHQKLSQYNEQLIQFSLEAACLEIPIDRNEKD